MPLTIPSDFLPLLKYALLGLALLLVAVYAILGSRPAAFLRGLMAGMLTLAAILAVFCYASEGHRRHGNYLNPYEFFHYYLGSKYFQELGYTNLYAAALIADDEAGRRYQHPNGTIRNLATRGYVRADVVLRKRDRYKEPFTEARWAEFGRDTRFFRDELSRRTWNNLFRDHGYNGSPVWSMVAGILSNQVSAESGNRAGLTSLALLDVFLLLAALGCVWWAFGYRAAFLLTIFLGTHLYMSHSHMKGAYLRMDWIACLVTSLSLVKKRYFKMAGVLLALSALARIFPAVFVLGPAAKFTADLLWRRRLNRDWLGFLACFTGAVALFLLLSLAYTDGIETWRAYLHKISLHNGYVSSGRIGFKQLFILGYDGAQPGPLTYQQYFLAHQVRWWLIQGVVLGGCAWCSLRLNDDERLGIGFVPVFFLFAPTYYYYIVLLVPCLFFAARVERPSRAAGLALMLGTSMAATWLHPEWRFSFRFSTLFSGLSLLLCLYMLLLGIWAHIEAFRRPRKDRTQGQQPGEEKAGESYAA